MNKQPLNPQQLLEVEALDEKTKELKKQDSLDDSVDPDVPLYSSPAGSFLRGNFAGDDNKTLGWLLGASVYGLIVGIIKSKFIRVLAPFIILGFGILGYLILKQINIISSGQ